MGPKIEYLEWETPYEGDDWSGFSPTVIWRSTCHRYRIGRIDGAYPRFHSLAAINAPGAKETTIQNDMRLLSVALISVEKFHKKKTGADEVITRNYDSIIKEAEKHGLDKKPVDRWADTAAIERLKALREEKKAERFEMDEESARKLLVSVGYGKARKEFNLTQLREKLNHLDAVEHTLKEPKKQINKNRLEDCLQALAKGQKIVITKKQPNEDKMIKVNSTGIRPLVCDPEHYPEDAQYVRGGINNETQTETKDVTVDEQYPDGETISPTPEESKSLGCLDAAAKVLAESGKPMSCKELVSEMIVKGYCTSLKGKTPNITLNSAIVREIKVGYKGGPSRFKKVGRGQFALNKE